MPKSIFEVEAFNDGGLSLSSLLIPMDFALALAIQDATAPPSDKASAKVV